MQRMENLSTLSMHIKSHKKETQKKINQPSMLPARIHNKSGQTRLVTVNPDDLHKLSDVQIAVCNIPKFGRYELKVNGVSPTQYITVKKMDDLECLQTKLDTVQNDEKIDSVPKRIDEMEKVTSPSKSIGGVTSSSEVCK